MHKDIIDAISNDDVVALKKAFDDAMISKIATAVEIKKQELGASIFGDNIDDTEQEELDDEFDDEDVDTEDETE